MMVQEMMSGVDSGPASLLEISIVNETPLALQIVRVHPTEFEEETLVMLGPGEIKKAEVCATDCLMAKAGDEVISQIGVSAGLPEWRLHDVQPQKGCRGPFLVENRRAETVNIFCTGGDEAEAVMIRVLAPGEQAVLESFQGDYWEATAGERVVSAYQLSARQPVWAITDVDCDFVPNCPASATKISMRPTIPGPSIWPPSARSKR
jgi:hypothetical protein